MDTNEIKERLQSDPDFINIKRFDYSMKKLLERYPDGAPPNVIAQGLMMTEEELEVMYQNILGKMREIIK